MYRIPLLLLLALSLYAGWRELHPRREVAVAQAAELEPVRAGERAKRKIALPELPVGEANGVAASDDDAPLPKTPEAVRERIRSEHANTYIDEILLARDSALVRWPDRVDQPLRVWVSNGAQFSDWDPRHADRVREAFMSWEANRIPVRFVFVVDSSDADIHVNWTDRFDAPISGKTLWSRDKRWWIVSGTITLALHHNYGEPLDGNAIYAIALHEAGHLLGLDHTTDASNIMTPRVRVRELSAADRATLRLLYSLPPGSIK